MRSSTRFRSIRVATATALAVASGTAGLASLLSLTSTAQADPASTTAEVGVGADVTQDLFAALTGASPSPGNGAQSGGFDTTQFYTPLHSSNASGDVTIASFDASPSGGTTLVPGAIVTVTGGPAFDRPNSSTAGLLALDDLVKGVSFQDSGTADAVGPQSVVGQINFARSARGPASGSSAKPGTDLTFIPYARDALGFLLYDPAGTLGGNLTTAELTSLYTSSTGSIMATNGANSETLNACLTISGSTPRSNLESVLGSTVVTDAKALAAAQAAHCYGTTGVTQNSGNAFLAQAQASGDTGAFVIPISSGSWISQANGLAVDRSNLARTAGVDLAAVDATSIGGTAEGQPYTGSESNQTEVPNTTYYQSPLGYNLYTVVPTDVINNTGFNDPALISLFVGSGSALCQASEQSLIHSFGFDSLTAGEGTCGSTTTLADG